jgi:WhiB family redox-sensing transcriptional regulator
MEQLPDSPQIPRALGVNVGEFLKTMQYFSGASVKDLAAGFEASIPTIHGWLRGTAEPSPRFHPKFQSIFHINRSELASIIPNTPIALDVAEPYEPKTREPAPSKQPEPISFMTKPAWFGRAACKGLDPDLFHVTKEREIQEAKRICTDCRVKEPCLERALYSTLDKGVMGETTYAERQQIRRRRRNEQLRQNTKSA